LLHVTLQFHPKIEKSRKPSSQGKFKFSPVYLWQRDRISDETIERGQKGWRGVKLMPIIVEWEIFGISSCSLVFTWKV